MKRLTKKIEKEIFFEKLSSPKKAAGEENKRINKKMKKEDQYALSKHRKKLEK